MYNNLIVPLDGSRFAEYALGTAARIAKASGAWIHLVTAHSPELFAFDRGADADDLMLVEEQAYLAHIRAQFDAESDLRVDAVIRDGVAADAICEYANCFDDALVIMTMHGRTGFNRAWVGSTADAVCKASHHAVLMLRPPDEPAEWNPAVSTQYARVLVPLDGSSFAETALAHGARLADLFGARLELLHVAELPHPFAFPFTAPSYASAPMLAAENIKSLVKSARSYACEVAARVRKDHPRVTVVTHLVASEAPALAIVDMVRSHGVDVVAMATHDRGVSRIVMPSIADKVLRAGPAAIMFVRAASD